MTSPAQPPAPPDTLKFSVAPNIVEDLGVNLYTSLPKALVEFVANAYDADAPSVDIRIDEDKIVEQVEILTAKLKTWRKQNPGKSDDVPLELQLLPQDVAITITDAGDGMTRDDLEGKFLVIGRRKRKVPGAKTTSDGGRPMMGRKGIGKLAGFGVAHRMIVESRRAGEAHSTRITLNLDDLQKVTDTRDVGVPAERLEGAAGLPAKGTRVTLTLLVFHSIHVKRRKKVGADGAQEAASEQEETSLVSEIIDALAEHFYAIRPQDFEIKVNGAAISPGKMDFEKAYPETVGLSNDGLVDFQYQPEGSDTTFPVSYRIRFRGKGQQLSAKQRGVRLYAHHRLAAGASLLDVTTSIHGFGFTAYMDAVVVANFLDERKADYISTDRNEVRWDSLLLSKLKQFLTAEMEKALVAFAEYKAAEKNKEVDQDQFTKDLIAKADLPAHRRVVAERVARILARADDDGVKGDFYKASLQSVVSGLGQGEILNALHKIAVSGNANLGELIAEITRLTHQEFDEFIGVVTARIKAIEGLQAICDQVDFKAPKNEALLHELFEKNPWLLDPTFFEFLASDQSEDSVKKELSKHLEVGKYAPAGYDPATDDETKELGSNLRPDLVFLLGNSTLNKVIIVELKAPNTPLHVDHLNQLMGYMQTASDYLTGKYPTEGYQVEGMLVGTVDVKSHARKIEQLRAAMKMHMQQNNPWRVFDIKELLKRTKRAHDEIMKSYRKARAAGVADKGEDNGGSA